MSNKPTLRKPAPRTVKMPAVFNRSKKGGSDDRAPEVDGFAGDRDDAAFEPGPEPEPEPAFELESEPEFEPEPASKSAPSPVRMRWTKKRVIATAVGIALLALLVAVGLFAWNRWLRYDDAADIQGVWLDEAGDVEVVLNESRMLLGRQLDYEYAIDTTAKTITYRYGDAEGSASYRFSDDRQTLVLDESGTTDWLVALHIKSDPAMGEEVPQGCTRLVRQKGYAQDVFSAYDTAQTESSSTSITSVLGRLPLYDSKTNTFYDPTTGYVYDQASGLFLDAETGMGYTPSELGYDEQAMINGLASGSIGNGTGNANGSTGGTANSSGSAGASSSGGSGYADGASASGTLDGQGGGATGSANDGTWTGDDGGYGSSGDYGYGTDSGSGYGYGSDGSAGYGTDSGYGTGSGYGTNTNSGYGTNEGGW